MREAVEFSLKPEEKTLDFILGNDIHNNPVLYKKLFFEFHIEEVLNFSRFKLRGLGLQKPQFQKKLNQSYLTRLSGKDKNGIYCKYERFEQPKIKIYEPGEWNDYKKIIEKFSFVHGLDSIILQKGNYYLTLEYSTNKNKAIDSAKRGFESFKTLVRKIEPQIRGRELNPKQENSNKLIIDFGSKKDKFPFTYEILLQDEIFSEFIREMM